MKKRALIACLSVIASLGINGTVQGADEPVAGQNQVVAQNSQTDNKDLLMFLKSRIWLPPPSAPLRCARLLP